MNPHGTVLAHPQPARALVRLVLTARRHVDLVRVSSAICPA